MLEEELFRLLASLERLGVWPSVLAWLTVAGGSVAMAFTLRQERRPGIWKAAAAVAVLALAANLADYFVTLRISPDLALEANPLWRNVVDRWGLRVAKWYGLTGKILISLLAGQMFAFFLSNLHRLYPTRARSFAEFLRRMGDRSKTRRERLAALFTLFAFFFAGIQLLYFYIAYLNWTDDPQRLPSVPVMILVLIVALGAAFAAVSYRAFLGTDFSLSRSSTEGTD